MERRIKQVKLAISFSAYNPLLLKCLSIDANPPCILQPYGR